MKSILVSYPQFRSLPKGIKRLLVTSESFFFGELKPAPAKPKPEAQAVGRVLCSPEHWRRGQPLQTLSATWRN